MNRVSAVNDIRKKLNNGGPSIGSWMQIPDSTVAEIMGNCGYDWISIDMEHGAITRHILPDLCRALELTGTLPLVRLVEGTASECKKALDSGAGGVIVPMIKNAEQLKTIRDACCWPPSGKRGVGFSRANMFGEKFVEYNEEAQSPLLVAMIENKSSVDFIEDILSVDGLDAVFIGPYDLSASLGITADFENREFKLVIDKIVKVARDRNVACGIHIVQPRISELEDKIKYGYQFIAYSIDSVFLIDSARLPNLSRS